MRSHCLVNCVSDQVDGTLTHAAVQTTHLGVLARIQFTAKIRPALATKHPLGVLHTARCATEKVPLNLTEVILAQGSLYMSWGVSLPPAPTITKWGSRSACRPVMTY
jgi:hypothetical protein